MADTRTLTWPEDGRIRAVVDAVLPSVDGGRFAVKRTVGERFQVEARCITDGHDLLRVVLQWRHEGQHGLHELPMTARGNDWYVADFLLPAPGRYRYGVVAWVDAFESWRHELARRADPQDIRSAAKAGAALIAAAAARTKDTADRQALSDAAGALEAMADAAASDPAALKAAALDEPLALLMARHPDRRFQANHAAELPLFVDRPRARFSSWYELFPRSASGQAGRHGTLRDVEARLPSIAAMGFDVLYLPPIHPVGRDKRKGPNNTLAAGPDDVGSPWAIGAAEGGHKDILPALGTLDDFRALVASAAKLGIDVALDIAFQCAPDHPYVSAHPSWFRHRPDGSVQYAENPPKKYQDIYPFNFETDDWQALWLELKSVFEHWIAQGVRVFRVDNPHTKSFAFWEWVIDALRAEHPELIFLAEAFTRPAVMHRLAKLGFSQSYTYFTWRQTKRELTEYFTELSQGAGREYFRPNAWPNTPDILPEHLHSGERAVFMARLVLAATLSANYGIYGPAYELLEHVPRDPGGEEYLNSEKYQLRLWDTTRVDSLVPFITRINRIRHDNPALQADHSLRFFGTDNDQLLAYAKRTPDGDNVVMCVVNLDPRNPQSGWVDLDAAMLGIDDEHAYQMHDVLGEQRFMWQGTRKFVVLDPARSPAHIFVLRRRLRSEHDFDYFL